MSATEFEIRQSQLPEIQLHPIEILSSHRCNSHIKDHQDSNQLKKEIEEKEEEENPGCRTPTSDENKIPLIMSCPPAPIKPKNRVILCKRKLSELQFFESQDGGRDQIESFFGSIEFNQPRSNISRRIKKKQCFSKL